MHLVDRFRSSDTDQESVRAQRGGNIRRPSSVINIVEKREGPMSKISCLILLAALASTPASAHVLLDQEKPAVVGADYKAVFIIPHGCAGSATVKLRVRIPEGVIVTKAEPKAGWSVDESRGKFAAEYDYHGAKVSEGVKEVAWSGGEVPDKTREEFVIDTVLTDELKPDTSLFFPVVQECEQGVSRWIEIPPDGELHSHELKRPAPGVKLTKP
jgi:periplasmic copper chaperone A